jgi:hypothetical protein
VNLADLQLVSDIYTIPAFQLLKESLKKAGLRAAERGITAAIQRAQTRTAAGPERAFKILAFDATTSYGASPGRSLWIVLWVMVVMSIPYMIVLLDRSDNRTGAIWRIWHQDRILNRIGVDATFRPLLAPKKDTERLYRLDFASALFYGSYFSLLSAFHIGWRDLNVGSWITRIQPREYVLRATGWVRVLSGIQSLLSVYLIALWVLTYFGRPFE